VSLLEAAEIYATIVGEGERVEHMLAPGRLCYVHVATGRATVRGQALEAGDALLLQDEPGAVEIEGGPGEVLLFDLPP
jgi:redox-sensitive bicupin YhaK (pirin superfamily)